MDANIPQTSNLNLRPGSIETAGITEPFICSGEQCWIIEGWVLSSLSLNRITHHSIVLTVCHALLKCEESMNMKCFMFKHNGNLSLTHQQRTTLLVLWWAWD